METTPSLLTSNESGTTRWPACRFHKIESGTKRLSQYAESLQHRNSIRGQIVSTYYSNTLARLKSTQKKRTFSKHMKINQGHTCLAV